MLQADFTEKADEDRLANIRKKNFTRYFFLQPVAFLVFLLQLIKKFPPVTAGLTRPGRGTKNFFWPDIKIQGDRMKEIKRWKVCSQKLAAIL